LLKAKSGHGKGRGHRGRNDKDEEKADGKSESDKAGSFVVDYVKKIDCNATRIKELFHAARRANVKVPNAVVKSVFKTCLTERAKAEAAKNNTQEKEEEEVRFDEPLNVLLEDDFKEGWKKENWVETEKAGLSHIVDLKGNKGMNFDGNARGESHLFDGSRHLTTWPMDMSTSKTGVLLTFDLKLGEENGEDGCLKNHLKLVKSEEDRKRKAEQDLKKKKKEQAEKARVKMLKDKFRDLQKEELNQRRRCENNPPCSGHGKGIYKSTYTKKKPYYNSFWEADSRTCTCRCNPGYVGKKCEVHLASAECQSVGDPHPLTLDGMRYNIYDAGEFLMFKHPKLGFEVHELTRMAHPRISATAGVAVKYKNFVLSIEQPHCGNGNRFQVRVNTGNGGCQNIGWGRAWSSPDGALRYNGGRYIYMRGVGNIYLGGWWRYRWWRGQCGSAYWLNVYIRVTAPKDGKSDGLCGSFDGNRNNDARALIYGRGKRHHHQISREARNKFQVGAKDSYFKCGAWKPGFRYSPYFKSLKSTAQSKQKMAMAAMVDAEATIAREFARDRVLNEKTLGDEKKDKMSQAQAIKMCKSKPEIQTEEALSNCVNDMTATGDEKVEKVAAQESEEEQEEAKENLKESMEEEKTELIAAETLKVADAFDPLVQYCTAGQLECERNQSHWKQLKAYPEKVYGTLFQDNGGKFKTMTARLPKHALSKQTQLRFFQANHTCYCCNNWFVDNVKLEAGGIPVALVADKDFELFADGKSLGKGEWFEPAKDTFRFRAPLGTETYAIKAKGGDDARSGILGTFGKDLVTSSSWRCTATNKDIHDWAKKDFKPKEEWPTAVEEGQNGILPWGLVPGIRKDAFWIFTHDDYRMRGQEVFCRVRVGEATHSFEKEEPESSRWSCKVGSENRIAPKSIQLNSDALSAVEVKNGDDDAEEHFSPSSVLTTGKDSKAGTETRVLMKIRLNNFLSQSVEGQMLKTAWLRLFVLDESVNDVTVCKIIRPWKAAEVTWRSKPAFNGPVAKNCVKVKGERKNEWLAIDISDWLREWITSPETNYGLTFIPNGDDLLSFVSYLDPRANRRPRISLSCHGDSVDTKEMAGQK
jgi:hypothetical protein